MTVFDPRWLGWIILNGPCEHGESGSGVFGQDNALLGVVQRNNEHRCYVLTLAQRPLE